MIKKIKRSIIEKIAAGEVIERPSSIIKELVENSIDANSKSIEIVIEQGGINKITVKDDGNGIDSKELELAVTSHATSKLSTLDDLNSITTLGFRGEALASIGAVSHLNIKSKKKSCDASELSVTGGKIANIKPSSRNIGTTVTVRKLFLNIPARRKFLKSAKSEQIAITKCLKRFFLSHPQITFSYKNEHGLIFKLMPSKLKNRICDVFGGEHHKSLIEINSTKSIYNISGFIGNIDLCRKRTSDQYLYINNRFVSNRMINNTIYRSYSSLIDRGEYPFFVLNIELPTHKYDINVHPSKKDVKFDDEWKINQFMKETIRETLRNIIDVAPVYNFNIKTSNSELSQKIEYQSDKLRDNNVNDIIKSKINTHVDKILNNDADNKKIDIDYVWQIENKYLFTPLNDGIIIIDQHVAHERILYESAISGLNNYTVESQSLLFPKTIDLKGDDLDLLTHLQPYLKQIGFKIREFGENKLIIESVPVYIKNNDEASIIRHIIENYDETGEKDLELHDKIAANYSCKAAIKAGDSLSNQEMKYLINKLFQTENPFFCPHGRPIIFNLTSDELDKKFERI